MSVKKRNKLIWGLALVLLVFVGGISKIVYSASSTEITITYKDEEWKTEISDKLDGSVETENESFDKKCFINTDKDNVEFTVNLEKFLQIKPNDVDVKEVPFIVETKLNDTVITGVTNDIQGDANGNFKVMIKLPAGTDSGKLKFDIKFDENNLWKIPKTTKTFAVTIDKIAPILTYNGFKNGEEADGIVYLDKNDEDQIKEATITTIINGEIKEYNKKILFDQDGSYKYNNSNEGNYDITISAWDRAGNKSLDYNFKFIIAGQAPTIQLYCGEINDNNEITSNDQFYNKNIYNFKLQDDHKINLDKCQYTVTYNGTAMPVKKISNDKLSSDGKSIKEPIDYLGDGMYVIDVVVADFTENEPIKKSYVLNVDTANPNIKFTNEDGSKSYGVGETAYLNQNNSASYIQIDDPNISKYTVTVKKDNIPIIVAEKGKAIENKPKYQWYGKLELAAQDANSMKFKFSALEDGKYSVEVEAQDTAGNKYPTSVNGSTGNKGVTFIKDTVNPVVSIQNGLKSVYNNTKAGKGDPEPVISISDNNYGTSKISISRGDKEIASVDENGILTKDQGETITVTKYDIDNKRKFSFQGIKQDGKYKIDIYAKDKADNEFDTTGNDKDQEINFTIDRTDPEINVIFNGKKINFDDFSETNMPYINDQNAINFDISVSGESIPKGSVIITKTTIDENGEKVEEQPKVNLEDKHIFDFTEEGKYKVVIDCPDDCGNETTKTLFFVIDKTAPIIEIVDSDSLNNSFNNEGKSVKVKVTENYYNEDNVVVSYEKITPEKIHSTATLGFGDSGKGRITEQIYNEFQDDAEYKVTVKAIDKAGNVGDEKTVVFTTDKTHPKVDIKGVEQDKHYGIDKTVDIATNDVNQKENLIKTVTLNGKELPKNVFEVVGRDAKTSYKFTEEGTYILEVSSTDLAGNNTTNKITFVIDKTAPLIEIKDTNILKDSFSASEKPVTINVGDNYIEDAGVTVKCKKTTTDGQTEETELGFEINEKNNNIVSHTYDLKDNANYVITVTAKDKAGNIADEKVVAFTIDKDAPIINFSGVDSNGYYDTDKTVSILTNDVNQDKNLITTATVDGKELPKNTFEVVGRDAKTSYNFTEEGNYVLEVSSTDKAGNNSTNKITFVIDKTAPSIEIVDFNSLNGSFNKDMRPVTVRVTERYYNEDTVSVKYEKITPDGNTITVTPSFGDKGKSEVTEQTYNEFVDDAEYRMTITAIDKAGNVATSKSVVFTTDKTNPSLSITGVDFDNYYNVDKTVDFSSTDVNQNYNNVTVTRNGENYGIGGVGISGRDAELSYTFSEEGIYEISFVAIDKAGNPNSVATKFTIDKTAPKITPMLSSDGTVINDGEYINKAFTPVFKLDNQEDTIETVTLNDGGNIAGNVPMASDEMKYNYKVMARDKAKNETTINVGFTVDTTMPQIKISGIMSGFFNEDMSPQYEITDTNLDGARTSALLNGVPFASGTTLDQQENYNFKLLATDLANNQSNDTISFTIDKDKPIIKFEVPMSGKYFTDDFVPNFIIDDLTDYTIISMTLDGEDYEVGDPVTEEGKHVLYIEVKDKAGNAESVSVEFMLDKTPPKFIIDGIEDGKKYYESTSATVKLDNPQDKINSVTVNGQLIEDREIDEFGQDVYELSFTDIRDYEVILNATDEAGNTTEEKLNFKVADKTIITTIYTNKLIFYPLVVGSIGSVAGVGTVLFRRRLRIKVK